MSMDTLDISNPTAESIKEAMDPIISTMYGYQTGPREPPSTRFLRMPNVSAAVFEDLDEVKLGGRLTYNFETRDLIIRIMPSEAHANAHVSLIFRITDKLVNSGVLEDDIYLLGAGRCTEYSRKMTKEPDSSMRPWPERPMEDTPPTLVIEAGVFEGAEYLREDAVWWLASFKPCVNVVILILLDRTARSMRLEVWKRREDTPVMTMIDLMPIDQNDTYHASQDLRICFEDIMLRPSPRGETEVVFTKEELTHWAWYIFRVVPRQ